MILLNRIANALSILEMYNTYSNAVVTTNENGYLVIAGVDIDSIARECLSLLEKKGFYIDRNEGCVICQSSKL